MSFHHKYLENPTIDYVALKKYGVVIDHNSANNWQIVGFHHLMPEENRGGHALYMDVKIDTSAGIPPATWGWEGQKPNELSSPFLLNKPKSEPGGNIPLYSGQKVWATLWNGENADTIRNIHTLHPDEAPGNTIGHHSFYVVWAFLPQAALPTLPEPEKDWWKDFTETELAYIEFAEIYFDENIDQLKGRFSKLAIIAKLSKALQEIEK